MLDLDRLQDFDRALEALSRGPLSQGALPPRAAGPLPRDIFAKRKDQREVEAA